MDTFQIACRSCYLYLLLQSGYLISWGSKDLKSIVDPPFQDGGLPPHLALKLFSKAAGKDLSSQNTPGPSNTSATAAGDMLEDLNPEPAVCLRCREHTNPALISLLTMRLEVLWCWTYTNPGGECEHDGGWMGPAAKGHPIYTYLIH